MKRLSFPKDIFARIAYGSAFCFLLPVFLSFWAKQLDQRITSLPLLIAPYYGLAFLLLGGLLMGVAMRSLWKDGKGLPMNAFPPSELVRKGLYRWISHPIYLGSVFMMLGIFLLIQSPAGVWIITPCLIAGIIALLYGFEINDLKKRFGAHYQPSELILPSLSKEAPTIGQRLACYVYILVPWALIYLYLSALLPSDRMIDSYFSFEQSWPVITSAVIPYTFTYFWIALGPFAVRSQKALRHFMISGGIGLIVGFALFVALPLKSMPRVFDGDGLFAQWLILSHENDTPACAFPSFHVFWACAGVLLWQESLSKTVVWFLGILMALSCLLTGIHSLIDVIAGGLLYSFATHYEALYRVSLRFSERVANSWTEVKIGSFRIINHGAYAGFGAFLGVFVPGIIFPQVSPWLLFGAGFFCMLGACLWGQWLEASSFLMRPFGYYGSVFGCVAFFFVVLIIYGGEQFWMLSAAIAVVAPLIQAIGRLRCFVQGCCHGRKALSYHGICYNQPQSRVVRIAQLGNTALYPTQLYSIAGNILLLAFMAGVTYYGVPASFIVGMYLILSSFFRFIEEAYRGEPQTKSYAKLAIYQWLAFGFVVAGAFITMLPSPMITSTPVWNVPSLVPAFLLGVLWWFGTGMDWPQSNRPLSRLT